MNQGSGLYFLGAVGAFFIAWGIGRSLRDPGEASTLQPTRPPLVSVQEGHVHEASFGNAHDLLSGGSLKDEARELALLASKVKPEDADYLRRTYEFAARLPLKEFPRALDLLREFDSAKTGILRAELIGFWMEKEPKAAAAYFGALSPKEQEKMARQVCDTWAHVDSDGVMAWLNGLPEAQQRKVGSIVRASVANILAQRDPELALSLLSDSLSSIDGASTAGAIFRHWARRDPTAAASHIAGMPPGVPRLAAFNSLMREWQNANASAARAWVQQIEDPVLALQAVNALGTASAINANGEEALRFMVEELGADGLAQVENLAATRWAERDGASALKWAQTLSDGPGREKTISAMLPTYAGRDPAGAAEVCLTELARGTSLGSTPVNILYELAGKRGADSATAFFLRLPEAEQVKVSSGAPGWLVRDGQVQAAIALGLQLSEGSTRQQWLEATFQGLAKYKGFQQAQAALGSIPSKRERDTLTGEIVVAALASNPTDATALAQTLPNGGDVLFKAAAGWLRGNDPTAARHWITQTQALTANQKQTLLQGSPVADAPSQSSGSSVPTNRIPRP